MADTPNDPPADRMDPGPERPPVVPGIPEGLYVLINRKTRTLLDLDGGNTSLEGANCAAWPRCVDEKIDHQFWAITPGDAEGTDYRITAYRSGAFLDLQDGKQDDRSRVFVFKLMQNLHQRWKIVPETRGYYTIQCQASGTFLEITDGKIDGGAKISCSARAADGDHQLWGLERASQTSAEIKACLDSWKPGLAKRVIQPYSDDVQYFVLPLKLRDTIWESTKLAKQVVRTGTFDYDDFVIAMKHAVNTWARDRLRLDGYSVLWGIIYGEAERGLKAYNWTLSSDLRSLIIFDPQTNREFTTSMMDELGFEPTVAIF